MNTETTLIWTNHAVYHNYHNNFETTDNINPQTGEYFIRAVSTVLKPGVIHAVPKALADELLAKSANSLNPPARLPSEQELLAYRLARGDFIERKEA